MTINKLLDNKLNRYLSKYSTHLYIGWVLFIGLLTLIPGRSIPNFIDWNFLSLDKFIHFSLFFILSFLGSNYFSKAWPQIQKHVAISITLAIAYGTVIEYIQTIIPQRGFDYADLAANIGGAIIGGAYFSYRIMKPTK